MSRELGVALNERGMLASYTDAHRVLSWMLSRPQEDSPKEVPWTVVALAA